MTTQSEPLTTSSTSTICPSKAFRETSTCQLMVDMPPVETDQTVPEASILVLADILTAPPIMTSRVTKGGRVCALSRRIWQDSVLGKCTGSCCRNVTLITIISILFLFSSRHSLPAAPIPTVHFVQIECSVSHLVVSL